MARVCDAREKKQDGWGEWTASNQSKEKRERKIAQQKSAISDHLVYAESTE